MHGVVLSDSAVVTGMLLLHIHSYQTIVAAGKEFGLAHFGLLATESMRLEKSYRHWKADLITEFNPFESGLGRFVNPTKTFVGKDELLQMKEKPPRRCFVTLEIDSAEAPAHPGDSIVKDGVVIGTISSAAWGYRVAKNLAMGFIDPAHADTGSAISVQFLGTVFDATVVTDCQYDPTNSRLRL